MESLADRFRETREKEHSGILGEIKKLDVALVDAFRNTFTLPFRFVLAVGEYIERSYRRSERDINTLRHRGYLEMDRNELDFMITTIGEEKFLRIFDLSQEGLRKYHSGEATPMIDRYRVFGREKMLIRFAYKGGATKVGR